MPVTDKLTDLAIRNTKPGTKALKLFDGGGLFLLVAPNGSRGWRFKYRFDGKEKLLSFGTYPEVPLVGRKHPVTKEWMPGARDKRNEARRQLAAGIDPSAARKANAAAQSHRAANSFELVSREWWAKFSPSLSKSHAQRNLRRLEVHAFPHIGGRSIAALAPADILVVLQRIEKTGHLETARRVRVIIGQVMRYAVSTGRAERDIAADLRDALPPAQTRHYAAVTTPNEVGALIRATRNYGGTATVSAALRLAPLVYQRPGELRQAEWIEFDLDGRMWTIPAARMKRRKAAKENGPDHLVPLSTQAVAILRELHILTGRSRFVFPSLRSKDRPMSDMALSAAFKRMGIDSDMALPHGWRATARTLLVEALDFSPEIVEMQLSHEVRDSLGRAYNRTQWLDARCKMMQRWADYLDALANATESTTHQKA